MDLTDFSSDTRFSEFTEDNTQDGCDINDGMAITFHSGSHYSNTSKVAIVSRSKSKRRICNVMTLERRCLEELISLLKNCICIWHKPTRLRTSRDQQDQAYQLLLLKLQQHQPDAKINDIRRIVRQLIKSQTKTAKRSSSKAQDKEDVNEENEHVNDHSKNKNKNDEFNVDTNDPTQSKTIIEKLKFLKERYLKNSEEEPLVCSFCNSSYYKLNSLWTHMLEKHTIPATQMETGDSGDGAVSSDVSRSGTRTKARKKRNKRRANSNSSGSSKKRNIFSSDAEASNSDWEYPSLRRSLRIQKRNRKRPRKNRRSSRESDIISVTETDASSIDVNSSNYYLREHDDKFLEKFIELYHQQECLWRQDSATYGNRKLRSIAYEELRKYCQSSGIRDANLNTVKQLIRRLRNYHKMMQKTDANVQRNHIWKRLAFIENGRRLKSSKSITQIIDCEKCNKSFKRPKYYADHMLRMHPPTECLECSERFNTADDLKKHLLGTHRKLKECPLCQQINWRTVDHMAIHFYDNICPTCSQIFHDDGNYKRHKYKCLSKNGYKCWHCNATFTGTMDFRRHSISTHHDERPFKCNHCDVAFRFITPLARHLRVHNNVQEVF